MANGRKLCGILAEMVDTTIGRAVVLGIGINVANESFPDELSEIATSVEAAIGSSVARDELLQPLLSALADEYESLHSEGGNARLVERWTTASSYAVGKNIRVVNGGEVVEGITRGIELDGALRIETSNGNVRIVRAGDVTLRLSAGK
jgi:BirA family biotin operon repressor/biotin-[acetyl-CoA-carboxylase] ligase